MERTDQQLVEAYLNGSSGSFDVLVRKYLKLVYSIVFRYVHDADDAQDVTQEVFVNVMRHVKRFDRTRAFKPWICEIARNRALDWLKMKRPALLGEFEQEEASVLDALPDPEPLADELVGSLMDAERVNHALAALPQNYREVLSLRYWKQMTFKEIGEELGEVMDTVKTWHRRALGVLRKDLVKSTVSSDKRSV
jgi:RNA polymerase sigma-70 factor, ECF subfamily